MVIEKSFSLCPPIRYVILVLSMTTAGILYLTRVNLNVTIVAMVDNTHKINNSTEHECHFDDDSTQSDHRPSGEFNWDPKTQGTILGSFFYGYVFFQILGGRLAEIWGAKWLCAGGLLLSGIINALTPVIAEWNVPALVASRVILGIVQAMDLPACYALLVQWFPDQERSTALGMFTAGPNIGSIVAMSISGWLSSTTFLRGWPSVFYVSGFLSGICCILWVILVYNEPKLHPLITREELTYIEANNGFSHKNKSEKRNSVPWKNILTSKSFIAVTFVKFTGHWNFLFVLTEVPSFLTLIYNYPIQKNGLMMSLIYICKVMSLFIGGIIADWIIKKKYANKTIVRKGFEIIAICGSSICLAIIPNINCDRTAVIGLFACAMFLLGLTSGGDIPFITDMTSHFAGTVVAIAYTIATLTGFLGPQFVGLAIDSDKYSRKLWSYVFYFTAGINIITIVVFVIFGNAERQSWDIIDDDDDKEDKGIDNAALDNCNDTDNKNKLS